MATSPDFSLSTLALKVHNSTFRSHSNDLALKDRSASLSFSEPSDIICPSNQSQFFSHANCSLESRLTPSSRLGFLPTPTKEVDLSGLVCGVMSASKLQEVMNAAKPGMVVTLPGEKWQMSGLVIRKSVCLKGCPGTTFELSNKIIISLSSDQPISDHCGQVVFSEMTFLYTDTRAVAPSSMFTVDCGKVELVLNDCYFRCTNNSTIAACFWMNKHSLPGFDSKLVLNGCFMTGFESGIRAGPGASVSLSRCYIAKCAESCISVTTVKSLQVYACVLEDSFKSAIELKTQSSDASHCCIAVDLCEIKKCRMHGVSIRGGETGGCVCAVAITRNAISQCDREGIILQSTDVQSVDIRANKVVGNSGSGLWLQNLRKADDTADISLSENLSNESTMAYGVYIQDADVTLRSNEFCKNHCNSLLSKRNFRHGVAPA